jgi:hypothetical protein
MDPNRVSLRLKTVLAELRAAIDAVGSVRAYAMKLGHSPAYIYQILASQRPPSEAVLDSLGIEQEITIRRSYRRKDAQSPARQGAAGRQQAMSGRGEG